VLCLHLARFKVGQSVNPTKVKHGVSFRLTEYLPGFKSTPFTLCSVV
jgi:hypothetical protein